MYVLRIATFAHGIRKVELVMRIISQDSKIDFPYNRIMLCVEGELVTARNDGKQYLIGKYSTEEKAVKAMEMCREQYAQSELNKDMIQKVADTLSRISVSVIDDVRKQLSEKYLFQFPADDEI